MSSSSLSSHRHCNKFAVPLVVDVDGSLVIGDLFIEGVVRLLAVSPLNLLALLFWVAVTVPRGRAALKRRVAEAVMLPPATLVLNPAVVNEIAVAKAAGREIWLASASDELVVAPLAETVGATGCLASDGSINLVGRTKATVLVEKFGKGGFDYIGNERRDLVLWKQARRAIGVNLSESLAREVRAVDDEARFLPGLGGHLLDYFQALRPCHWIKNILVFVPLVAAHETKPELYLMAAGVFTALSACASGTYLWNDLFDLPHDRRHQNKRHRPLASGKIRLLQALSIGTVLVTSGLIIAFWLSITVGLCVLLYVILTFAYSLLFKRKTFIDVIALAVLFALRVLAGAAVVSVALSHWFIAFSFFIFLALALVKRQCDLYALREANQAESSGRAYFVKDLAVLAALGASSSFASTLVLALYIRSPEVHGYYARPEFLWGICLLLVYWLGRMMLLANRGAVGDDPVVFAMGDRASWLAGIGILAMFTAAL